MSDAKPTKGRPIRYGIYALTEDNVIRYIGQSKNIDYRYKQHTSIFQNSGKTKRHNWLRKMILNGKEVGLLLLEITKELDDREIYWINYYRDKGLNLVNTADGGKTNNHMLRAKKNMPWGNGWSPIQRFIIETKKTIVLLRRMGQDDNAERLKEKLELSVSKAKIAGLDAVNMRLWAKYGK